MSIHNCKACRELTCSQCGDRRFRPLDGEERSRLKDFSDALDEACKKLYDMGLMANGETMTTALVRYFDGIDEPQGPVGVSESLKDVKRQCKRCGRSRWLSWLFSCPCCGGDFCFDTCSADDDAHLCQDCSVHHDRGPVLHFCSHYRAVASRGKPVDPDKPHPYHKCPKTKITFEHPRIRYCDNCITRWHIYPLLAVLEAIIETKKEKGQA